MIKLFLLIMFVYLLIKVIMKHNPNSPLIDLFEFFTRVFRRVVSGFWSSLIHVICDWVINFIIGG